MNHEPWIRKLVRVLLYLWCQPSCKTRSLSEVTSDMCPEGLTSAHLHRVCLSVCVCVCLFSTQLIRAMSSGRLPGPRWASAPGRHRWLNHPLKPQRKVVSLDVNRRKLSDFSTSTKSTLNQTAPVERGPCLAEVEHVSLFLPVLLVYNLLHVPVARYQIAPDLFNGLECLESGVGRPPVTLTYSCWPSATQEHTVNEQQQNVGLCSDTEIFWNIIVSPRVPLCLPPPL